MNFKAYDIFASLVPGFILLLGLQYFFNIPYDKDYVIGYTAFAFLLGYTVNTLGSWLEDFYFFTWGGNPSSRLLSGKNIWKVRFYNHLQVREYLLTKCKSSNPSTDELFAIAMRSVNGEKDTRIEDFNSAYALSRTLLTTVIIGGILVLGKNPYDWKYHIAIVSAVIVLWIRCKQRSYYYVREVLNVFCKMNNL